MSGEWQMCEWRVELWVDIMKNLRKKRVKSLELCALRSCGWGWAQCQLKPQLANLIPTLGDLGAGPCAAQIYLPESTTVSVLFK